MAKRSYSITIPAVVACVSLCILFIWGSSGMEMPDYAVDVVVPLVLAILYLSIKVLRVIFRAK